MTAGLEPGDRVGPYTVVGLLGAASPGWVHLARTDAGRPVAVRLLYGEQRGVARARKVRGPGVVEVLATGGAARSPWVASTYVAAPSLADLVISCGPLPPPAVRWLAAGIAEALVTIHQAGLVHGDLRPAQVLMASDGPRVTGFGIERGDGPLTAPGYLAPEQARGDEAVPASDVYALGALLCFAATGRPPHDGPDEAAIRRSVAAGEPDLDGVPARTADLIRSLLVDDPDERPTPRALLDELADSLSRRPGTYGSASWLPEPALALIDGYHRRGRVVGDPPTAGPDEDDPEDDTLPPGDTPVAPVAAVDETMRLDAISAELVPRIDDVDDRRDGYDLPAPAAPRTVGAGWLVVVLVVLVAAVGGVLTGVGYQRSRDDGGVPAASPSPSVSLPPVTPGPVAVFAASLAVGACVDFATDGVPGWQPTAPRTLACDDPAARQRVLARTAADGAGDDCMNTDGRSRWPVAPGAPALCMERVFHEGECVPADERDGRQWAFLAYLTPCTGAVPQGRAALLRIDEVRFGPTARTTGCSGDSPVYYALPSRGLELCMSRTD